MNLIVTALKQKLAPFGWTESLHRGGEARGYAVSAVRAGGGESWGRLQAAPVLLGRFYCIPNLSIACHSPHPHSTCAHRRSWQTLTATWSAWE